MKCPKCSAAMKTVQHEGVEVDRCSGCGGLWFDTFEHEQLRELDGAERVDNRAAQRDGQGAHARIDCPRCATPMFRMVAAGQPHIAYESCGLCHGAYFDAGEFRDFCEEMLEEKLREQWRRVRAFVAAG